MNIWYLLKWISILVSNILIVVWYLIIFSLALEPVLYNGVNFFNTSRIHLDIIRQSDYSYLELICHDDWSTTYPCSTLIERYNCLTILEFNGILGCTYKCYFMTEKLNYNSKYSDEYKFTFCEYLFTSNKRFFEESLI